MMKSLERAAAVDAIREALAVSAGYLPSADDIVTGLEAQSLVIIHEDDLRDLKERLDDCDC